MYTSDMEKIRGKEATFTAVVAAKVEPETSDAMSQLARANHRSKSAEARLAILRHIEREKAA